MLVLSRRFGERLVLIVGSQKATIEVLSVSGNRARVGVDAPRQVRVVREEIFDEVAASASNGEVV
jgi:carbon storage regulator